ncbi:MAG: leucine-rich repeat protein, partial [Promethearchaeota archaeon]
RNQISKIEGLDHLSKLKFLSLYENKITNIEGLEKLCRLEELILFGNPIKDIGGLENLSKLKSLSLDTHILNYDENELIKKGEEGIKKFIQLRKKRKIEGYIKKIELLKVKLNIKGLRLEDYHQIKTEIDDIYKKIEKLS